jgi:hypothetical protein
MKTTDHKGWKVRASMSQIIEIEIEIEKIRNLIKIKQLCTHIRKHVAVILQHEINLLVHVK